MSFLGYFFGVPLWGTISDYYGRRSVMICGFFLFMAGSFMLWFFPNLYCFLLGRLMQGFGMSSVSITGYAALNDLYKGKQLLRVLGMVSILAPLYSVLCNLLGGYITQYYFWFILFDIIFLLSSIYFIFLYFGFRETNKHIRKNINFESILQEYKIICSNKKIWIYLSLYPLALSTWLAFKNISTFYFQRELGFTPLYFGQITAIFLFITSLGGVLGITLVNWFSVDNIIKQSNFVSLLSSLCLILVNTYYLHNVVLLSIFLSSYFFSMGMICGPTLTKAFSFFPKKRGLVASLKGCVTIFYILIATTLSVYLPSTNLLGIIIVFFVISLLKMAGIIYLSKIKE